MAVVRTFLILWIFLFTQVFASQEFVRNVRGTLIINSGSHPVENYREAKARLMTIGLTLDNVVREQVDGREARRLSRSIREETLRLSSRRNPDEGDMERIGRIREMLTQFEGLIPAERLREIYDASRTYGNNLNPNQLNDLDNSDLTAVNTPGYCSNYSLLDRETMEGFYRGAEAGEGDQCFQYGENYVGLDLTSIGQAMVSLEGDAFQTQSRQLKNGLIKKSVQGILEEAQSYSGLFPGVDNGLERLSECAGNDGKRRMGNGELEDLVNDFKSSRAGNIDELNNHFEGAENRKKVLIANQVRQALIAGNLYNITSRARQSGDSQIARTGGMVPEMLFPQEAVTSCQQRMAERFTFYVPESDLRGVGSFRTQCESLVENGVYPRLQDCFDAFVEAMRNPELRNSQEQCLYTQSGRNAERPRTIQADRVIPLMSTLVDSNPLLFDRRDNRNLIPFMSSESDYRPSPFANRVMELPGASSISTAVLDLLETNPENPAQAISDLLDRDDMKGQLSSIIAQAQENESLKNSLKDEVESYQDELAESAAEVCENDGRHLHQFPTLVNDVISEQVANSTSPAERQNIVARMQAAQCWMLQDDPPEETGGLSAGMIGLGVGMIALGFIPVIGWAAAAGLMVGGSGIMAVDALSRNAQAQSQLRATEAAFHGGWAETNQLLLTAARATDANTNAWAEALSFGVLDVAGVAFRLTRGTGVVADTIGAVNRVEDIFQPGERALRNCINCNVDRIIIRSEDLSHAREHIGSLGDATAVVRGQLDHFEEIVQTQLRGVDEIQGLTRTGNRGDVGRIGELLDSLNLTSAELNTLRNRINPRLTPHRMGIPSENWIPRLRDPNWLSRLDEDGLRSFFQGLEEGVAYLRDQRVQNLRAQITDGILAAENTPFRRGKPTSLFPDGVSPEVALRGIEDARITRVDSSQFANADELEVLDFTRDGVGYRMFVCRPLTGSVCRRGLADGSVEEIEANRLITIYPRCQPGVSTLRRPIDVADAIISGSLTGNGNTLDINSLVLEPASSCQ